MKALLCAGVAVLSFAQPAAADIVTVTVTGKVAPYIFNGSQYVAGSPVDQGGVFGSAGAHLAGDAFSVIWTVNTNCACAFITSDERAGGSFQNSASPILSSTLTIAGHSYNFNSSFYAVEQVYNNGTNHSFGFGSGAFYSLTDLPGQSSLDTFINSNLATAFMASQTQPFNYTFNPLTDNLTNFAGIGGEFTIGSLAGYLDIQTMTLTNPSAVPGPVIGTGLPGLLFGFIGWLWKRRRRQIV